MVTYLAGLRVEVVALAVGLTEPSSGIVTALILPLSMVEMTAWVLQKNGSDVKMGLLAKVRNHSQSLLRM
jgi:hypothetical protein